MASSGQEVNLNQEICERIIKKIYIYKIFLRAWVDGKKKRNIVSSFNPRELENFQFVWSKSGFWLRIADSPCSLGHSVSNTLDIGMYYVCLQLKTEFRLGETLDYQLQLKWKRNYLRSQDLLFGSMCHFFLSHPPPWPTGCKWPDSSPSKDNHPLIFLSVSPCLISTLLQMLQLLYSLQKVCYISN